MSSAVPEVRELLAFHYDCLQGMYFSSHEKTDEGDLLFSERKSLSGGNPDGPTEPQRVEVLDAQWEAGGYAEKRAMLTSAPGLGPVGDRPLYPDRQA